VAMMWVCLSDEDDKNQSQIRRKNISSTLHP
jgi:hypothetical protein